MPNLSSKFISYGKALRKPKTFAIRRYESPNSPHHPYASSDVVHITPTQSIQSYEEDEHKPEEPEESPNLPFQSPPLSSPPISEDSPSPQLTPVRPITPPQKLHVELSSDSMTDWIPSHLMYKGRESVTNDNQTPGAGSSKLPEQTHREESAEAAEVPDRAEGEEESLMQDGEDSSSMYDDDGYGTVSSDDSHIVANLEALDASSFVNTADKPPRGMMPSFKKTAPTPIKIPNPSMHGPKVQVIRSSGGTKGNWHQHGFPSSSRPESIHSGEDYSTTASAVSGTTLARALIGNTFVLSADERAARYRSGGSVLTRTDSATLPRDENPFLYSPLSRSRKLSGASDTLLSPPDLHSLIPMPANADSVYIPPSHPRRSMDSKRKRQSTGSLMLRGDTEGDPSLVRSNSIGSRPVSGDVQHSRRISRISEATSSSPSIPDNTAPSSSDNAAPFEELSPPPSGVGSLYASSPFLSPYPDRLSNVSNDAASSNRPISSTSSGKEYDSMLDSYYSTATPLSPITPETPNSAGAQSIPIQFDSAQFRPPFSPISEESSSQLSPPTPYRQDSRGSMKSSLTGSPNGPRATRTPRLLPIGESSQPPPGPTSPVPESATSLLPPPVFSLFNRQRSGSAPNPIKIVRDSQDLTSYNLISTRPISTASSPTTGSGSSPEYAQEFQKQTFPETPSAFSPMWSAGSQMSPGMPGPSGRGSMDQILIAVPPTPMTAGEPMPALAQHMLARAASSVRGARHTRQPSNNTRARTVAQHLHGATSTLDSQTAPPPIPPEPENEPEPELEDEKQIRAAYPSWVTQKFLTSDEETSPSIRSERPTSSAYSQSVESPPLIPPLPALPSIVHQQCQSQVQSQSQTASSPPPGDSTVELSVTQEEFSSSNASQTSLAVRGLPPLPPSPSLFGVSSFPAPNTPLPVQPPGLPNAGSTTSLVVPSQSDGLPSPLDTRSQISVPSSAVVAPIPSHLPMNNPPTSADSAESAETEVGAPSIPSMGSPPPYYTLVFDQAQGSHENMTPTSGGSGVDSDYRNNAFSPHTPPSSHLSSRQSTSSIGARPRRRPPLPIGPRRPSQATTQLPGARPRNASISSLSSNAPNSRMRAISTAPNSPRFHTPAPKWRGYTMDAAKWTFTSTQLQAIVSRAIKQSAEASAIRLLRMETVDNDIPTELHRLEMQRTDIKTRYKIMTRRRTDMLATLTSHVDGSMNEDSNAALRVINELRDVSSTLDRTAEDLHSVDEQIAQLTSLRDVHDASALAMAIRKLNASFLKQLAVSDALRGQVMALEAERDDAWKQAEKVAGDFDRLSEKVDDAPSSNRSSRVLAMRKSSIRVSKAGLRSTRSSMSSTNRLSTASFSGAKSTFSVEDIPPVPPIPRQRVRAHRPVDILTDLPSTRSFLGLSTDGPTPNTETRAMQRAHEELCDMLGIANERPRRSQSVIERARSLEREAEENSPGSARSSTSGGRPLSMPDRSGLTEVYQNMTADGNAMLATLGLLADAD